MSYTEPYQELEIAFANYLGTDPSLVVSCSSGTAALHLALESFELLKPFSTTQVLIPDYTMIACPRAVTLAELTPVLVDCGSDLLLDYNLLTHQLMQDDYRIQCLMLVHIYGRKCDDRCFEFADKEQMWFIEDMAEAHTIKPDPRTDAACYSFYKNKIIAGEEGGAVVFKHKEQADLARMLKSMGFTKEHDYTHIPRGCNYRLSNSNSLLILDSLASVERSVRVRNNQIDWYDYFCPDEWRLPKRQSPWVYDIRIPGITKEWQDKIVKTLNEKGIQARHGFKPISSQVEYQDASVLSRSPPHRPESWKVASEVIYLLLSNYVTPARTEAFEIIKGILKEA